MILLSEDRPNSDLDLGKVLPLLARSLPRMPANTRSARLHSAGKASDRLVDPITAHLAGLRGRCLADVASSAFAADLAQTLRPKRS